MILGQSAGAAASIAYHTNKSVQNIDYEQLKNELLRVGQILEWSDDFADDPLKRMEETFGKK